MYVFVTHACKQNPHRPGEISDPLDLELVDCELSCGSSELNPGPPIAQAVLLTEAISSPLISKSNQSLRLGLDNGAF